MALDVRKVNYIQERSRDGEEGGIDLPQNEEASVDGVKLHDLDLPTGRVLDQLSVPPSPPSGPLLQMEASLNHPNVDEHLDLLTAQHVCLLAGL